MKRRFPDAINEPYWRRPIRISEEFFHNFVDTAQFDPENGDEVFIASSDHIPYGVDLRLYKKVENVLFCKLNDAAIFPLPKRSIFRKKGEQ